MLFLPSIEERDGNLIHFKILIIVKGLKEELHPAMRNLKRSPALSTVAADLSPPFTFERKCF